MERQSKEDSLALWEFEKTTLNNLDLILVKS